MNHPDEKTKIRKISFTYIYFDLNNKCCVNRTELKGYCLFHYNRMLRVFLAIGRKRIVVVKYLGPLISLVYYTRSLDYLSRRGLF